MTSVYKDGQLYLCRPAEIYERIQRASYRASGKKHVIHKNDLFARAELAMAESDLKTAATLMKQCLRAISSEDLDFRALVNQQLFKVHRGLARSAVLSANKDGEMAHCF